MGHQRCWEAPSCRRSSKEQISVAPPWDSPRKKTHCLCSSRQFMSSFSSKFLDSPVEILGFTGSYIFSLSFEAAIDSSNAISSWCKFTKFWLSNHAAVSHRNIWHKCKSWQKWVRVNANGTRIVHQFHPRFLTGYEWTLKSTQSGDGFTNAKINCHTGTPMVHRSQLIQSCAQQL